MIRASQQAVVQEANIHLINIRNAEVKYFNRFYTNFGTQAAFMIGIVLSAISQVPGWSSTAPFFFIAMFWIGSVGTISGAVHILVCTVFITVFGEGLALRGPPGSMVAAVRGMIREQQQVIVAFTVTIFMFANFASGMYWIMCDQITAIICTAMTFGMLPLWYHYSLRIYNRFYWGDIDVEKWEDQKQQNPATANASGDDNDSYDPANRSGGYTGVATGYLSMKGSKILGIKPWQRLFFVVEGQLMHFYPSQNAYEKDHTSALNKRPVDLDGYSLIAGAVKPPFTILLVPVDPEDARKTWHFRCDTRQEFERWVQIFSLAMNLDYTGASFADDTATAGTDGIEPSSQQPNSNVIRLEGDVGSNIPLMRSIADEADDDDASDGASSLPAPEANPVVAML